MGTVGRLIARILARLSCAVEGHRWLSWMPRVTGEWIEVGRMRMCNRCPAVERETYPKESLA